jgi:hypothetical protein
MDIVFNIIGLSGAFLLLLAFFLLERGVVGSKDPRYLWMNLISAIMIGTSLLRFWNMPSFVIECAWALISIRGLFNLKRGAL